MALEQLDQIKRLSRSALAEMRILLMELRPEMIVRTSLHNLLKQLAESAKAHRKIVTELTVIGDETPLPPPVHTALYRLAQECHNNVVKHSQTKRLRVTLRQEDGAATLTISDDGRGSSRARR